MDEVFRDRLRDTFRWIDPDPDGDIEISDYSGWWRDAFTLAKLAPALVDLFPAERPTVVLGAETAGLLLGPLVARELGVGFVAAYKDARGLLAGGVRSQDTTPDYRGRVVTLSIREGLITPGDLVLVVDDWAETGAQLVALRALVTAAGAGYAGAALLVDGCPPALAAELNVRAVLTRAELDPASLD